MPVFLPIELVEDIIHRAVETLKSHPKGASSIALLSHRYRTIAHTETFSSVMFLANLPRGDEDDVRRIHGLAKLIANSSDFPTLRGVHTFTSSFSLKLSAYRGSLRGTSEVSRSLITIINHLFRDAALLSAPRRTLTLTSCTWTKDEALDVSLRSLITTSYINTLYISDPFYFPVDIILGSNIEHFTINGIVRMDRNFYTEGYKSVPLKSLSITGGYTSNVTFDDVIMVICGQDSPTRDMFSQLTSLSINVTSPDLAASLVNSTKRLESLTLHKAETLFPIEDDADIKPHIRFQYLRYLKELNIAYSRTVDNEKPQISPVTFFGHETPPLLEKIILDINMNSYLHTRFPTAEDDLNAAVQERQEISEWDNYLSSSRMFCNLKTIRVNLMVMRLLYFYEEDPEPYPSWDVVWCPYFMAAFPMCKGAYDNVVVTYSSAWAVAG